MPRAPGLSYRLIADYAFAGENPYIVGPVTSPTKTDSTPQLIPVPQFTATVGLHYEWK